MDHVREVQASLRRRGLAGLVVPSTDKFLSEFTPPNERRLWWTTGFRGSTGMAIVLQDAAALFLDGRYLLQGRDDTSETEIAIESSSLRSRRAWLARSLSSGGRVAMDPWLHSMPEIADWRSLAFELGFELELLRENPIDELWAGERPCGSHQAIVDYPIPFSGEPHSVKCARLIEHINEVGLEAVLVADPEDVSWLLNVRAESASKAVVGEWPTVPSCRSRALVLRNGRVRWFVQPEQLSASVKDRDRGAVTIEQPDSLATALRETARQGIIGADLRRTPAALTLIVEETGRLYPDDTVARSRWRKHASELSEARRVHIVDAAAVVKFMAWLIPTVRERSVTEIEAAEKLEAFRSEHPGYKGPSMPLMSASGASGARPHYVPRRNMCRCLNDHPVFWMDSGGQYLGGTTDNTIALAISSPEPKHVLAHTLVLQSFIALATLRFPAETAAFRLDAVARQSLWREGMDYGTGTGHGVGNYLNIHEGPIISKEPGSKNIIALEPGMIISNEPGYYAPDDFGVRIESHMIVRESGYPGFMEFETISRLPIDPHLVDFARLSLSERRWLADYHQTVEADLEPLLDMVSRAWLRGVVQTFIDAGNA